MSVRLTVALAPPARLVGVRPVIVGALADTVKLLALVAVPPDVVTLSGPVVAPAGTVACIAVVDVTVKVVALVPLRLTERTAGKVGTSLVTLDPSGTLVGVKPRGCRAGNVRAFDGRAGAAGPARRGEAGDRGRARGSGEVARAGRGPGGRRHAQRARGRPRRHRRLHRRGRRHREGRRARPV